MVELATWCLLVELACLLTAVFACFPLLFSVVVVKWKQLSPTSLLNITDINVDHGHVVKGLVMKL